MTSKQPWNPTYPSSVRGLGEEEAMKAGYDTYLYKVDPDSHLGSQASIYAKQVRFMHRVSVLGRTEVDGGLVKQIVVL